MARPQKQGIDYFTFDVGFFEDTKIKRIRRACGGIGIAVLVNLLCTIYREEGYYIEWNDELGFLVADDVGAKESIAEEVKNKALQVGFFDETLYKKHNILTSKAIQKRFKEATKRRKNGSIEKEYDLINGVSVNKNEVNVNNNSKNDNDNEQSKEKESKEKNNKKESGSMKEDFEKLWKLYPKKQGKKKAFDSYKRAIKAGTTNKEIQDGIVAYKKYLAAVEWLQPANGSTWFNQERWQDDYSLPNDQSPDNDADLSWLNDPEIMGEDAYERTT